MTSTVKPSQAVQIVRIQLAGDFYYSNEASGKLDLLVFHLLCG